MAEHLPINTGPLIALARSEALGIAGALPFEFICPREVEAELAAGAVPEHPWTTPGWLTVLALQHALDPVAIASLDVGEAAVIQLAREIGARRVCMDERKGRRVARAVGLEVVGTLGLLLLAKRRGQIPAVRPFIERLQATGTWYHPALVARVLAAAGE